MSQKAGAWGGDSEGMSEPRVRSAADRTEHKVTSLRTLRLIAGFTQKELAVAAGLRRPTISALESGRQKPRPETARRIADALGYPAESIFPDDERPATDRALVTTSAGTGRDDREE